jgi:localization factor PodJL
MEQARRLPGQAMAADNRAFENPRVEIIVVAAAVFAALLTIAGLFWTHDRSRATELPLATARHSPSRPTSVALIDATGNSQGHPNAAAPSASSLMAQANRGNLPAQTALAEAFLRGTGEESDSLAAARWSLVAAERGEPSAQFILGTLYSDGIKPNPQQALKWFFAAASRGNVRAMHNLGVAFLGGQGVARDPETAVGWFRRAANLGYRDSAFDLGVLYERGEGVSQDPQEALKWYDRASSAGDQQARQRASFLRSNLSILAEK